MYTAVELASVQTTLWIHSLDRFTSEDKGDHLYTDFQLSFGSLLSITGNCTIYIEVDQVHVGMRYNYDVFLAPSRTTPYTPDDSKQRADAMYVHGELAEQIKDAVLRAWAMHQQSIESELASYCFECEERHYGSQAVHS